MTQTQTVPAASRSCQPLPPCLPAKQCWASLIRRWILGCICSFISCIRRDPFAFLPQALFYFSGSMIICQTHSCIANSSFFLCMVWILRMSPQLSEDNSKKQWWQSKVPASCKSRYPYVPWGLSSVLTETKICILISWVMFHCHGAIYTVYKK